jgi:hypothetical protein
MPEIVIQGQSAVPAFARPGGLTAPGSTMGNQNVAGTESSYVAGVSSWSGESWVAGAMAQHAARANRGYADGLAPFGAAGVAPWTGSPSLLGVNPYTGSPSLLGVHP